MQGVLNINKSKGMTSFDVIARLRKLLNIKKIGHSGTLDPIATGVLPVFIGNATRLIQYAPKTKSYRAFARLGIETNTYDIEGEILQKQVQKYDIEELKSILKTFTGKQIQIPPIFSAIKVNGKKLYEYARKEENIEIPKREVEIFDVKFVDFIQKDDYPLLVFDIDCASGVYVRSIIHDLGEKLGSGAMMENLIRTMSANMKIEDSIELENLTIDNILEYIINPNNVIELPKHELQEQDVQKIKNGQYIFCENLCSKIETVKLVYNNTLIAIGEKKDNIIQPKTVII